MGKLYIVMYHYVRELKNSRYPGIKGMDIKLFRKQIAFFKQNFNIVTMEQVIDASDGKVDLPPNAMLLTFDDGYIDGYTYVFPILKEEKLQGSFFISGMTFSEHQLLDVNKVHYILASADIRQLLSDVKKKMDYFRGKEFDFPATEELFEEYAVANRFDNKETIFVKRILQTVLPERLRNRIASDLFEEYVGVSEKQLAYEIYLTKEQIRTMKNHGMFIGFHGYNHYWLGNLPKEKMQQDILKGLEVMDEFLVPGRWVMNYPYGSYNADVLECVKKHGACLGLTADVRIADLSTDGLLELPRLDCNDFPPKSENYKNI
ncbi:MAG: polysaccharide deacetylase family protein [Lachnospiraceae bacterium]|nr:polysaccharide deacetylase family protein [Lachnospiraceae bacterium]